jgi:hypothetical protein
MDCGYILDRNTTFHTSHPHYSGSGQYRIYHGDHSNQLCLHHRARLDGLRNALLQLDAVLYPTEAPLLLGKRLDQLCADLQKTKIHGVN